MRFYTRAKRPLVINVVSLIDILAILLIFFIVTTTFKKAEPQVEIILPQSSQATEDQRALEPTVIHITRDQNIFIGDRQVTLEQLSVELRERATLAGQSMFALKADEGVPLGFFVKILDLSKEAGLENLSLFTEPQPSAPQ